MKNFIKTSAFIIALLVCINVQAQTNSNGTTTTVSPTDPNGNVNPDVHQNPSDPTKSGTNEPLQQEFNTDGNGYENLTPANIMDSQSSGMGAMIPDKKDSTAAGSSQTQISTTKKTKKHTN